MTSVKWANIRKAFYALLPIAQWNLIYYGFPDEAVNQWVAAAAIIGTLAFSLIAIENVDMKRAKERDVSRETSRDLPTVMGTEKKTTVPCEMLHGSADAHVLGCEGWREAHS